MNFTLVETPGRIEEENILPSERAKHLDSVRSRMAYLCSFGRNTMFNPRV